jgi:hypothetical protein
MARSASLSIRVLVDAAQGASELRGLGDSAATTGDQFKQMLGAAAAFAGVTAFIKSAVSAASDLQQSTGGVEAVFKNSASAVKNFASGAAQSLGLSKSAYQELATVIGSQLKNAGTSMEELAPKTNSLIEKGADLAAMFGGTTAEAVGALSSALKGERDPIERYGVSLNQAAIDAEIMAKGMDTSTNAAKAAATQQATLNLIMKQTADSQGAAAREADSYASVMQQLSAIWENTIAEVGAELLPALSSLVGTLGDLAPVAAAILGPLAEFAGWVLQLPAPILAVAAGIALWKFSPLSSMLGKLSTALSSATGSASGFATAAKSIGSALAGGAILGGAMIIIGQIASAYADAKARAEEFQSVVSTLGDELVRTGGKATDAFSELQRGTMENTTAFKALTSAGISYGDAMNFFTDQSKLSSDAVDAITAALGEMDPATIKSALDMTKSGEAASKYAQEKMAFLAAEQLATGATEDNSAATAEAAAAQAKAAAEQQKAAEAAAKQAAAQTQVSVALDTVKASTDAASRALDFFTLAMDKAAGRQVSVEQASLAVQSGLADVSKAFADATTAGTFNADQLAAWDYAALQATDSGRAVYSSLSTMRTGYDQATTAAYSQAVANGDAAGAMDAARYAASLAYGEFITMAQGAGLSATQAQELAAKLGIVEGTQINEKTFSVIAEDAQAQAALLAAQGAVIDPKSFDVSANPKEAQSTIGSLVGQSLKNTLALSADPKAAQSTINGVVNEKRTTTPVRVVADPSQANSTINGFTQTQRSTQVEVTANATSALQTIGNVTNGRWNATVTVGADTGPALSAISRVEGGSYSATIVVSANTAGARAAIAAVPTSVSVAPAPPAGLMAMGATAFGAPTFTPAAPPPLHGISARSEAPSQSVTYEINVSNTLDSADTIARRVLDVIEKRERRIYGIRVQAR